jgi:hypothetical protein
MLLLADVVDIDILRGRDQGRRDHQSQNKINWGLTVATRHVTTKRPFAAVLMTSLAMAQLAAAHAADPGFCRQYARSALDQVRAGLSDPACGSALQGSRWSSDFAVHYEWCLGVSLRAAADERDFRTHHLKSCAAR